MRLAGSAGNFRHPLAKFRKAVKSRRRREWKCARFRRAEINQAGARLAPTSVNVPMFRAAVLSIVLTLTVGPNATLLCAVWCHPDEAKTSACQHRGATTSRSLTGEDSCRTVDARPAALVRDEGKPGQRTSQPAAPVPRFASASPRANATWSFRPKTALAVVSPPLLVVLRI